jgi:hypothetical protein
MRRTRASVDRAAVTCRARAISTEKPLSLTLSATRSWSDFTNRPDSAARAGESDDLSRERLALRVIPDAIACGGERR